LGKGGEYICIVGLEWGGCWGCRFPTNPHWFALCFLLVGEPSPLTQNVARRRRGDGGRCTLSPPLLHESRNDWEQSCCSLFLSIPPQLSLCSPPELPLLFSPPPSWSLLPLLKKLKVFFITKFMCPEIKDIFKSRSSGVQLKIESGFNHHPLFIKRLQS